MTFSIRAEVASKLTFAMASSMISPRLVRRDPSLDAIEIIATAIGLQVAGLFEEAPVSIDASVFTARDRRLKIR